MPTWKKVVVSGSGVSQLANDANYLIDGQSAASLTGSFSGSFVGDGSGLTGLATNLAISGSTGNDTVDLLNDSLSVVGSGGITTSVTDNQITINSNGLVSGSDQVTISDTTGFSSFSSSLASGISSNASAISSNDTDIANLQTASGSFSTRVSANEAAIANLDSTYATDAQLSSVSGALASGVAANASAIANLDSTYATDVQLSSVSGALASSITSNSASFATTISGLNSIYTTDAELNASSSAISLQIGQVSASLAGTSDTINTRVTNVSSSLANSITSTNSSLTTISGSLAGRVTDNDADITGLGAYTASLKSAISTDGANLTVIGNLEVQGTTTTVNSTTVELDDNILSLNGTGAVNGGIQVNDPNGPASGSLIWDGTANEWKAGGAGAEVKILRATGDSIVSSSIQIDVTQTTGFSDYSASVATTVDGLSQTLGVSGDTGTDSIDLKSQTLEVKGDGAGITTTVDGANNRISLVSNGLVSSSAQTVANLTGQAVVASSFSGDGSNLTNVTVNQAATVSATFTNVTSTSVSHNFDSRNVNVAVYDSNFKQVIPDSITLTDLNTVDVTFCAATSGHIVVGKGGHIVSGSVAAGSIDGLDGAIKTKINTEGVISGSVQVDITGTTGYSTFSSSLAGDIASNTAAISALDSTYATDAELAAVSGALASSVTGVSSNLTSVSGALASSITANASAIANLDSTYATDAQLSSVSGALESSLNVEKGRIDAILLSSDADKDSFAEIVTLINSVDTTNDQAFATYFTSSNNRIGNLESFSSSLDTVFATDSQLDSVSSSLASSITGVASDLSTVSGSIATTINGLSQTLTIAGTTGTDGVDLKTETLNILGDGAGITTNVDAASNTISLVSNGLVSSSAQLVTKLNNQSVNFGGGAVTATSFTGNGANLTNIPLGTATTGDYVEGLVAGTGISITNNSGEGATPTIATAQDIASSASPIFNDLTLTGDLNVAGTTTTTNQTTLTVSDSKIFLADGNVGDALDTAIIFNYNDGVDDTAGMFRDATDGSITFFSSYTGSAAVGNTIDTTAAGFALGTVKAAEFDGALSWNNVSDKPDPTITVTLGGHVTGTGEVTLTDLADGVLNISSSIPANTNLTLNDLVIDGNLTVTGTTTENNVTTISSDSPLVILNTSASGNPDVGLIGKYDSAGTELINGFFRDATDGVWKVFDGSTQSISDSALIDTTNAGFSLGTIQAAEFSGSMEFDNLLNVPSPEITVNVAGDVTGSASATLTELADGVINLNISIPTTNNQTFNNLNATGDLGVTGNASVTGNATVSGDISADNLTLAGNLTVNGTTTTVNSTTVEIEDNILSLNGLGATNGGIQVNDPNGPASGSLLWNSVTNRWVAGGEGSESTVLLATGDNVVSGSVQVDITGTTGYATFSSSLATDIATNAATVAALGDTYATDAELNASSSTINTTILTVSGALATDVAINKAAIAALDGNYATDAQLDAVSSSLEAHINSVDSAQSTALSNVSGALATDIATNAADIAVLEGKTLVSASVLSSPNQGTAVLTSNGVGQTVDLGLQSADSPTFANLTLTGNLTVTGDTISANIANLDVEDRFILLNSGSNSGDTGIIFGGSNGVANQGAGIFFDNPAGVFGFAGGIASNATAATHVGKLGYIQQSATLAPTLAPDFQGVGAMHIKEDTGCIYIYA